MPGPNLLRVPGRSGVRPCATRPHSPPPPLNFGIILQSRLCGVPTLTTTTSGSESCTPAQCTHPHYHPSESCMLAQRTHPHYPHHRILQSCSPLVLSPHFLLVTSTLQ
ncbi:hypothetical protein BGY98DRAFT_1028680 [Russula aff. rugulosa BPL654]|nr:hypothetical protein BGY98DRAFT_1028680 [Russula aff. rugulosa BPL654]